MKQNQYLAELRDWLLPMLMNGQVKVESAEVAEEEFGEALNKKLIDIGKPEMK